MRSIFNQNIFQKIALSIKRKLTLYIANLRRLLCSYHVLRILHVPIMSYIITLLLVRRIETTIWFLVLCIMIKYSINND